jgi:RNA polymerase sigma-70 factor (ECF subfamily)
LLAACARGERAALQELFRRHGPTVRGTLRRLRTLDERDIEDLVQTTFLEVRRSATQFRARAAVGTWIVGIARNLARHHARGEGRRRAAMSAVAAVVEYASQIRPDDEAARRQMLGRLQPAFEALPAYLRSAFTLCDLEGMRGAEAAHALQVPEGTVWRRVHEARLRLRATVTRPTSVPRRT